MNWREFRRGYVWGCLCASLVGLPFAIGLGSDAMVVILVATVFVSVATIRTIGRSAA